MHTIPFIFTPKDSLELVKYHNQKSWENDIKKPRIALLVFMIKHQTSPSKALKYHIERTNNMADRIIVMAAYQHIMSKKVEEYNKLCVQIVQIKRQQSHLETNQTISDKDKKDITEFYTKTLADYNEKKQSLLQVKEVCHALNVQFETVNA